MILQQPIEILWVAICAGLVFFMQAGFLCLETGLTRSKNNINVAVKNMLDFGLSSVAFFLVGYGLMFGGDNGFVGLSRFAPVLSDTSTTTFFLFQLMFCGTAVTIISGAAAERLRIGAYFTISVIVALLIYPIFGHWVWAGLDSGAAIGWLASLGFHDFAGGTVVHVVGGFVAAAVLHVIGSRTGRFPPDGPPRQIQASNLPLATLGVFILFFGWFGFNGGSLLGIDGISSVIANTVLSACSGMIGAVIISFIANQRVTTHAILNGPLAGLVAITACADVVTSRSAMLIGLVGALVMYIGTWSLDRFKLDDAVTAVPVHLFAGLWGSMSVGLFGNLAVLDNGLNRVEQIAVQGLGNGVALVWAFGLSYVVFTLANRVYNFRVSLESETVGLNISEHNASTELVDFYQVLETQAQTGDLSVRVPVEPFTEVGQIASRYNYVLDKLEVETQKTNAVISTAMDGILTVDAATLTVTLANEAAERIFESDDGRLAGQRVQWLFLRSLDETNTTSVPQQLALAASSEQETQLLGRRVSGTTFPAELSVSQTMLDETPSYVLIFRDISDRVAARAALREAQERLQTVVRNAPLILFVLDVQGRFVLSEGSALHLIGLEPGQVVGQNAFEIYAADPIAREAIEATLQGESRQWVTEFGGVVFDSSSVPLYDEKQTIIGMLGVSHDITEQTKAERAQRRFANLLRIGADIAEQVSAILETPVLLKSIVELLKAQLDFYHVQLFVVDRAHDRLESVAASGELGQRLREYGEHLIPLDHPTSINVRAASTREMVVVNDTQAEKSFLAHPLLANTRSELAIPLIVQDQLFGVLDIQDIRPSRFQQAELYLFSSLAGQLATALYNAGLFEETQRVGAALAQQEQRVRTLYEIASNPDLSLLEQLETALTAACSLLNMDAGRVAKITPQQYLVRAEYDPQELLPNDENSAVSETYSWLPHQQRDVVAIAQFAGSDHAGLPAYSRAGAEAFIGCPIVVDNEQYGSLDFIRSNARMAFTESDENFMRLMAEWLGSTIDRARAQRVISEARDQAVEASRFKTQMLANVSHELRTPLGVIIGYGEMLQDGRYGPVTDKQFDKTGSIINSARHLSELVGDLLDVSQIEAGKVRVELTNVDPRGLLEQVAEEMELLANNKGLALHTVIDDSLTQVETDPERLRQVCINLLNNAIKFTDEGRIRFAAHRTVDDRWQLVVADTGVGIPAEKQATIFQPFVQVDDSATKLRQGAGLGLAIVKQFVEAMGGTISCESYPEMGTVFVAQFPLEVAESAAVM